MENINLDQFTNLRCVLRNKEQFRFTLSDYRKGRFGDVEHYRIIDDQFKNVYDPLNYVSIDIHKNYVELHCVREGSKKHIYELHQREIDKLSTMTKIEVFEYCIISAVDKWNCYFD